MNINYHVNIYREINSRNAAIAAACVLLGLCVLISAVCCRIWRKQRRRQAAHPPGDVYQNRTIEYIDLSAGPPPSYDSIISPNHEKPPPYMHPVVNQTGES